MKIALAQLNYHIGNFEGNLEKMQGMVTKAKALKADIVVFGELATCGYPPRDFLEFDDFIRKAYSSVETLAEMAQGIAVVVGSPARNPKIEGKDLFNAAFFLADGKKFATRSGDTVKLKDLLDEAVRIAGKDLRERYRESANDAEFLNRVDRVASIVGIGAIKYADLSMNRESNYRFSYERMLSLNGNTAPYMLYAYARICSIVRKAVGQPPNNDSAIEWPTAAEEIIVSHDSERELLRNLVRLPDVIREVELDLYPNRLCDYLFETSQKFNQFYENCSVMNAETPELKASRLSLCTATAGALRLLLTLLGIQVVEKL